MDLEDGTYVLVPLTTGALLTKPNGQRVPKIEYVSTTIPHLGRVVHPLYKSAIKDVFRKFDMVLNRVLDVEELKIFGHCSGLDYFKKIKDDAFDDGEALRFYSSNDRGLTQYGFAELLTDPEEIKEADLLKAFKTLGYDENLYSLKSRTFITSIHSDEPIKVQIGDALTNSYQSTALDLVNDHWVRAKGEGDQVIHGDNHILFVNQHPKSMGTSFSIINQSDNPIEVTLDMSSEKKDYFFTPSNGKITRKIKPHTFVFLAAAVPPSLDKEFFDADDLELDVEVLDPESEDEDEDDSDAEESDE